MSRRHSHRRSGFFRRVDSAEAQSSCPVPFTTLFILSPSSFYSSHSNLSDRGHYFDHEQASQVPYKALTQAISWLACSILSSEGTLAQIVQICRSGSVSHSAFPCV